MSLSSRPHHSWRRWNCRSRIVLWFFALIWRKRLTKVVRLVAVDGWRSCVYDLRGGQRCVVKFMFRFRGRIL